MKNNNINFIFFGTPDVASKTLEILKSNGYLPTVIVTSPDKPQGRKMIMTPTPVKNWAIENNIPYLQPEKIDQEFYSIISNYPSLINIVVAYGKILPEKLINLPKFGTINVHYSLLPKYRGASPLEACLLNGDTTTGISIQKMKYKLDSGPIFIEEELEISINDTKEELRNELINLGANCLCDLIPIILSEKAIPKIQNEKLATYCTKTKKEDGEIDLNNNSKENWNKYRAYSGWPETFFYITKKDKKIRIKIKEATYENNSFVIKRVVPEGKNEMSYSEFLKWN